MNSIEPESLLPARDPLPVDWSGIQARALIAKVKGGITGGKQLREFLGPNANSYHSSLNPIFLFALNRFAVLCERSVWLIRDGLQPLLWFFKTYPTPMGLTSKLLIDQDFLPIVPEAWRPNVGSYFFCRSPAGTLPLIDRRPIPNRLLIFGANSEAFGDFDYFRMRISEVIKKAKPIDSDEIFIYLPCLRSEWQDTEATSAFVTRVAWELPKALGHQLKFLTLDDLHRAYSWDGWLGVELNDKLLCADSYVRHFLSGKGMSLFLAEEPAQDRGNITKSFNPDREHVPTSLGYGFTIKLEPGKTKRAEADSLTNKARSSATSDYPWRTWYRGQVDPEIGFMATIPYPSSIVLRNKTLPITHSPVLGNIDQMSQKQGLIEISGWALDQRTSLFFEHYIVVSGNSILPVEIKKFPRTDVMESLKRDEDSLLKIGFEIRIPKSSLVCERGETLLWVIGASENSVAHILFAAVIDNAGRIIQRGADPRVNRIELPESGIIAMETDRNGRREKFRCRIIPASDARSTGFGGSVDRIWRAGNTLTLFGWAGNTKLGIVPEAIGLVAASGKAVVVPALNIREDVATRQSPQMFLSGFSLQSDVFGDAPHEPLRLFAIYAGFKAVELTLPALAEPPAPSVP